LTCWNRIPSIPFSIFPGFWFNIDEMKEQIRIPTGKVERAARFIGTGAKIGRNYVRHYTRKLVDRDSGSDELHRQNAEDIYASLSHLKGSALKVAQMMSMDKNLLPRAYQEKFALAQYSAPPLSYPLVVKTFHQTLGKGPEDIFESFTQSAVNAASIGQVHQATLGGRKLAVKVQYPGVAESISSDLRMVKPVAKKLFNISEADLDYYLGEVQGKLMEETDYHLELSRATAIAEACNHLPGLFFPKYYPEFSSRRILTMDWVEGMPMDEFLAGNPRQEHRDRAGQTLWDFYEYQIHALRMVHADPHPGNFVFTGDGQVGILDFGCVKEIPEDFYRSYFRIHDPAWSGDSVRFEQWLYDLEFLSPADSAEDIRLFGDIFYRMVHLLGRPFFEPWFDFGDETFFAQIYELGEQIAGTKEIRSSKSARGPRHGLYINRTYFGLYHLLNQLRARVETRQRHFNLMSA
jgi:predicted unusual protein kinase regulating ubiquinone biosynthesis (AarF/ABC1/UbiB family)